MPFPAQNIRKELAESGEMTFARFMELALYCPEVGFYEKEADKVGRAGDFYTSVSVGSLFGELLACQFAQWLGEVRGGDCGLRIVEAGAHDGRLAADILGWFQRQRPELFAQLEYCLLEPSARRREWQRKTLAEYLPRVTWLESFQTPEARRRNPDPFTIILSNELLDAMPVHRFGWDAARREWFEWGVATGGDRFIWTRLNRSAGGPPACSHDITTGGPAARAPIEAALPSSRELLAVLPDGYTLELNAAAERWWGEAARWLRQGKLVTFDYGLTEEQWILPERTHGTLRAYRNHKQVEDVLADPGEQDLTAHVNFTRIEQAGRAAGLKTEVLETQGRFLTQVLAEAWKPGSHFGEWTPKRSRQFQTLTHPQHLGQSFRVLIQSRGC